MNDQTMLVHPLGKVYTLPALLRFAMPTIAMMLFMGFYTIVDTIFVARFVNTDALSAINIVCPIINLIVGIATMIATGGNALVARKLGEQQQKEANEIVTLIVLFGAVLGVMIAIIGGSFLEWIVYRLGANKQLFPYAKEYLSILLLFVPASMLQVMFQSLIVTAGKPGLGLSLSFVAGAVNIMLDGILIIGLDMGIQGAALGTGIGYMISALAGIFFFSRNRGGLSFCIPSRKMAYLLESCANGSSEMVSQLSAAVTTIFFNYIMMKLSGERGVAAITILIYSQFLLTTFYIGYAMGIAPILSYHYGANMRTSLYRMVKQSCLLITGISWMVFILSQCGQAQLITLFVPPDTDVYTIIANGFGIFSLSFLFSGLNIFASAALTAVSNGKASALISFLRTFVFILIGLCVLPVFLDVTGVWLAVPGAEFLTFLIVLLLFQKYRHQYF